jgi:peptidyl-tRNA hydrolase, PTH1 family
VKLIVGLGNPGVEYDRTRHNVGFEVVDRLARRYADPATAGPPKARFNGLALEGEIAGVRTMLLKPLTFMNLSGNAVGEAVRFYKLDPVADLLVLVDDVALACGVIRLRTEGSAGGHNGLADIEQKLGTSNYARLRIGVDNPGAIPRKSYVIGRFRPDQRERLEPALDEAVDAAACWAIHGVTESMNRFNRKNTA